MINENINYVGIFIDSKQYNALYDDGATTTIVGKAIADQLRDRIIPTTNSMKVLGNTELNTEVDGR